jgi:hypothetical protein
MSEFESKLGKMKKTTPDNLIPSQEEMDQMTAD